MRKSNQEIRDPAIIGGILSSAQICRVAMLDGDRPYLLPFNFGYRNGCIYIHSAPEGKKIDLLKQNPSVCFEVEDAVRVVPADRACNWATSYRSVVGYATAEILEDHRGKVEGLKIIMVQHGAQGVLEFEPRNLNRMVILKLTISSMTGKQSAL